MGFKENRYPHIFITIPQIVGLACYTLSQIGAYAKYRAKPQQGQPKVIVGTVLVILVVCVGVLRPR